MRMKNNKEKKIGWIEDCVTFMHYNLCIASLSAIMYETYILGHATVE